MLMIISTFLSDKAMMLSFPDFSRSANSQATPRLVRTLTQYWITCQERLGAMSMLYYNSDIDISPEEIVEQSAHVKLDSFCLTST